MIKKIVFPIILGLIIASCNFGPNQKTIIAIKDPNNAKPMAIMMRLMAQNADSMRALLLRDEQLDSNRFPFVRFQLVEPTDTNVLEAKFFSNADRFEIAHKNMFNNPYEQKKYYNLMIKECQNCHDSYCKGPLKKINQLPIEIE